HYLAFDLFVGCWEMQDSQKHNIPHVLVVPCLLFTFMLGPIGLVCYLMVRWFTARQWAVFGGS
ncbi:MAG: abscisic acid-deficient protein Aba4 family protein, partial [Pseudohongiellaceae bacterium]